MVEWIGYQNKLVASWTAAELTEREMIKKAILPRMKENRPRRTPFSQVETPALNPALAEIYKEFSTVQQAARSQ